MVSSLWDLIVPDGRILSLGILLTALGCSFGSVGNKQEEDALILENIIRLARERTSRLQIRLFAYDNQLDSDLGNFTLQSGDPPGDEFEIEVLEGSGLELGPLLFRINPPDPAWGSPESFLKSQSRLETESLSGLDTQKSHTPYTVPLELPQENPYGKVYQSSELNWNAFYIKNGESARGSVARINLPILRGIPYGILASAEITIKRWDLLATVSRTSDSESRTIRISIRDEKFTILPRCRIPLPADRIGTWDIGFRYSSLLSDQFISGTRIPVLQDIFAQTAANEIIIATDPSLDLYPQFTRSILRNLQSEDRVLIQESCEAL